MPLGIDANRPLESAQSRVDLSRFVQIQADRLPTGIAMGVMVLEYRYRHVFPRSNLNGRRSVHCPPAPWAS
jgi:hypothetical protein